MKTIRKNTLSTVLTSSRQEWPQPSGLNAARSSAGTSPLRGVTEQPARQVPGWRLPSGQLLVEYALRAGLASSPLLVRLPLLGEGSAGNSGDLVMTAALGSLASSLSKRGGSKKVATVAQARRGGRS